MSQKRDMGHPIGGSLLCGGGWGVGDGVELAGAEVHAFEFGGVEGAGATAAEDSELVAALVDGAVAVDAFRDSERW